MADGNNLDNILNGTPADDSILGFGGNDHIDGLAGNDTLDGGDDNDVITGDAGNDSLIGGNGDDSLDGGADNDKLDGGGGNDTLLGGNGDDFLDGGAGNDSMTGGAGANRFAFELAGAANGFDTVTDYVHGIDSLYFTGDDYGMAVGANLPANMFTAGTAAVGTHAQFIWDDASQTLYWDDDGTGADAAVAIVHFTGAHVTIDATDFHFKPLHGGV